jgi:hypothetical protein
MTVSRKWCNSNGHCGKAAETPSRRKNRDDLDYRRVVHQFTPQITSGVWVGYDDKQISLGKKKQARAQPPVG